MPKSLKTVLANSTLKKDQEVWFYNNIRGTNINSDNAIAQWKTDVFLNGVPKKYSAANPLSRIRLGRNRDETQLE